MRICPFNPHPDSYGKILATGGYDGLVLRGAKLYDPFIWFN